MSQNFNNVLIGVIGVVLGTCLVGLSRCDKAIKQANDAAAKQQTQLEEYQARVKELEQQVSILEFTVQNILNKEYSAAEPEEPIEEEVTIPLYDIPLSDELQEYTYTLCEYYSMVDYYEVVLGIMKTESNFDAGAVSRTDDYGIMQINACNHEWLKSELDIVDIMDVRSNIECGIYILSGLVHKYDDANKVLMAYNLGPTGAARLWDEGIYINTYGDTVLSNTRLIKSSRK